MVIRRTRRYIRQGAGFLLLSALILSAFYVSVGRIAVNAVNFFREDFVTLLETSLQTEVYIGELKGSWRRIDPTISITNLVVGPDDDPAIELGTVSFRLSSLYSFLERTPILTEVNIDGLKLTVEQRENQKWVVLGLPANDEKFDTSRILDLLSHVEELSLNGLDLNVNSIGSDYHIGNEGNTPLQMRRSGKERVLAFPLLVQKITESGDSRQNKIYLTGDYSGELRRPEKLSANLYFKMPQVQLTDFMQEPVFGGYRLVSAQMKADLWLEYANQTYNLIGNLDASEIELAGTGDERDTLEGVSTRFKLTGSTGEEGFQIFSPQTSIEYRNDMIEFQDLNLVVEQQKNQYLIAGTIPLLDLGELTHSAKKLNQRLGFIPERGLAAIEAMNPRGRVEKSIFVVDLTGEQAEVKITSNIREVSIEAYLGAPAISSLNGFVSLRPDRGYMDINNSQFDLHFASMFPASWPFESTRGRVNYRLTDGVLHLNSGLIELINGELSGYGKVHVKLPKERDDQTWGLIIGVNNADLVAASRFLPNTLSEDFLLWLKGAVLNGTASETALLFHGSLFRGAPKIRKIYELYLKVEDTRLDYDEEWPMISDLQATIYINNHGVYSNDAIGSIMMSQVKQAMVEVLIPDSGGIDTIHIEGSLEGPMADGIRLLTETPLAAATNYFAERWSGTGMIDALATLEIPIGTRKGEETFSDVTVELKDNSVTMPEYEITLENIDGSIRYQSAAGLSAEGVKANLFGKAVIGGIESELNDGGGEIKIDAVGKIDMRDLQQWSAQTLLTTAEGVMDYNAEIHIPFGSVEEPVYVVARSDLNGVTIDMPLPMKKVSSDTEMSLFYQQTTLDSGFQLDFQLGEQVRAALKVDEGIVTGGQLVFGADEISDVSYEGLNVTGDIAFANYEEWDSFIEKLDQVSEVAIESEIANKLDEIKLDVAMLDVYTMELPDTRVRITREENAWLARLDNVNLSGEVLVKDGDEPINIRLDYLRFFEEEGESTFAVDPFADVVPQEMLPIDFSTKELTVDGEAYGSWQFQFRPNENGADFYQLRAEVKGMSIAEPSRAYWTYSNGVHYSGFDGPVLVEDLGVMLEQWGYASSVEGKDFVLTSSFGWPGSPAMVELETVEGSVLIEGGKGRFVQAETGTAALKLLGIFDFNQLGKRLTLDFSDVVDKGYSFNGMKGKARFDKGIVEIMEPLFIKSAGSNFKVGGRADLNSREINGDVVVTLPVGKNLPWYAAYSAIVTGPLVGAGVFLAQKVFEDQINTMTSAKYEVTGTIEEPTIKFITFFDDNVRESAEAVATESDSGEEEIEQPAAKESGNQ